MSYKTKLLAGTMAGLLGSTYAPVLHAQDVSEDSASEQNAEAETEGDSQFGNVIIVTAQKKGAGEDVQSVPLAITAFDGDALENLQVGDVQDLSYAVPNVAIDSSGTVRGLANFSIRGLGVTSSVPTVDPTVGTFVDGVYIGTNYGVILDTFDLDGIEILRGPQGLLFGRNVTGGAVLVNTRKPSHDFSGKVKFGIETGLQTTIAASINGSLVEDVLAAKVVGFYKNDEGYFTNIANGNEDFGGDETYFFRGALGFTPSDNVDFTLRLETGNTDGDGPANQNRDFATGHDVKSTEIKWYSATLENNIDVALGDGVITTILGWRQVENTGISNLDSNPNNNFNIGVFLDQEQFSAETRYTGSFFDDRWTITTGLYYFTQDIIYREFREIFGGVSFGEFGGNQDQTTFGIFASNEFKVTDSLTLLAGARYTYEEKTAQTAFFQPRAAVQPCVFGSTADCTFDFTGEADFENFSPKLGFKYDISDDAQIYGSWSRGFRSGGFNLRNTIPDDPGPTDDESQSAFELGFKGDWLDGRLRTNLALFRSDLDDLQRVVTTPSLIDASIVQQTLNTADARIQGLELEVSAFLTDSFLIGGHLGIIDGEYTRVFEDLNRDGVVDAVDETLELPLLADLTWGVFADFTQELSGIGELGILASYSFRSEAESNDQNAPGTTQPSRDIVNASIRLTTENELLTLALFGKNLTNEVINQTITNLPGSIGGGTIQPIAKGRVFGFEATVNF